LIQLELESSQVLDVFLCLSSWINMR